MRPLDPEVQAILECAPRPINDNYPCWKGLASYFETVLSSQPEGFHEFRLIVRRDADGSVLLYMPTMKELR